MHTRMAIIINKTKGHKYWRERREIETFILLGEYKMVQLLWTTVQQFLKRLNIELPYHPTIPPLGIT